jgi:hypothetical protein
MEVFVIHTEQQVTAGSFLKDQSSVMVDLVQRYRVCWEVWPEYLMVGGKQQQVGFELELSGTLEPGTGYVSPGCPVCRHIYNALLAIADCILPKEERPSRYEIEPYEQALRYSAVRGSRPDVTLSLKILHRRGFDQPVDPCEVRCLDEMKQRLKQLGACERQWSSRRVSPA